MQNILEYFLFISFSYLFKILGLKLSRKVSVIIALFFYYIIPIRKETVLQNLKYAFPDYTQEKIKKISYENYKSFAVTFTEIMYLPHISRKKLIENVECVNLNILKKRYEEGNPIILLTAHFGNWEYMATSTGVQLNLLLNVVIKNQRNPYVTKWLKKNRTRFGNSVIPMGIQIRKVYQKLKEKQIVIMAADQRGDEDSIRVNLFGRSTSVFPGPATLALKTNAVIICAIPVRQKDKKYKIVFEELNIDNLPEELEDKKVEICQRYTSYLQKIIEKNPEQWLWMHKRWKH
ncbi:MAG TPA: hypothetical protein ENI57_07620 [Ignavibacteria bacterium]|nr:hypothetical protein [Ignavibacteria bacterium]